MYGSKNKQTSWDSVLYKYIVQRFSLCKFECFLLSHKCNYNFWFTVCCIYFQGFSLYIIPWPGNTKMASRLHVSHATFFILSKACLCMTFAMSASIKSISAFNKVLFNCYLASNTKKSAYISNLHSCINYEQLNVIKSHCDWSYIPHNLAMI